MGIDQKQERLKKPTVTFSTKCWENDWEILLKYNRLAEMIDKNSFDFDYKILIINNVDNPRIVEKYAKICQSKKLINDYYFVDDYANDVLEYFCISKSSFGKGYHYSICELFEIYLSKTDFLVHFSSDTILEKKYNWIDKALDIFVDDPSIAVINPCWNRKHKEAKKESFLENENYYSSFGFSDQCYMLRLLEFKGRIYNEKNPVSERYPKYADEPFERRVDAYLRNQKRCRATLKNISYLHKNWTIFNKLKYRFTSK